MNQEKSGLNTGLLILILLLIVGLAVWWFTSRQITAQPNEEERSGIDIDVNLPPKDEGSNQTP